jgi:hypothetical protein
MQDCHAFGKMVAAEAYRRSAGPPLRRKVRRIG